MRNFAPWRANIRFISLVLSGIRVVVPPFLCVSDVISRVWLRITKIFAWAFVYTDVSEARCVGVYKSDLIALDDSSTNIRALTVDAWTFITFGVDVADAGQRTILG